MKKLRITLSFLTCLVTLVSILFLTPSRVSAECTFPAYCDAAPGTCATGNVCNGGNQCVFGETICPGVNPTDCRCEGGDGPQTISCTSSNTGANCRAAADPYSGAGICKCTYTYQCGVECIPRPQPGCCSGGGCGWTSWSACSVSCGGGTQSRTNTCNGTSQTQACNTQACCTWGAWGACSGGQQSRSDNCGNTQTQSCTNEPPGCTAWSSCSASCGPGTQTRVCNGNVESQGCNNGACCGSYGPWGACSVSCGGGTQTRSDSCGNTQSQACNTQECTCSTGTWSACSATCGVGTRSRTNSCVSGGIETEACDTCSQACACPVACGQATNCGTCSDGDLGEPGPITLNPSSGNLTVPADRQVTVSWTTAVKADNYDMQIYPTGTTPGQECTAANTFCTTAQTATNYTFTAPTNVVNYSWRVKPNNTTCNAVTFMSATASDEYLLAEGASYDMTANLAVDGNDATAWNAGGFPTQWIELDLKTARDVTGIRIATNHFPAGNATYQIYAGSSPNPTTLVHTVNQFINPGDILTVTFSSAAPNTRYVRVVGTSSTSWVGFAELTPYYSDGNGDWTNGTFTLVAPISGNIYLDQNFNAALNLGTGLCEMSGTLTGQNPGTTAAVTATWTGSGSANGNITGSTYTIGDVPNYNNVGITLAPDGTQWRCTCPFGCTYSGQGVPAENINFFIANVAQPWWQTSNGMVYAGNTGGNAVVSLIPSTCTASGTCIDAFSYRSEETASSSSGITITGGGDIDVDADAALKYSKLREESNQAHVIGSVYNGPRENYQYFYNLFSMGSSPTGDFTGSQPTNAPVNGRAYYGAGNITLSTPWSVAADEKLVVFVNGNLNVNTTIDVAEGGFLTFIVSGNITFGNTIGNSVANDLTPTVEGVFIADRIIVQGGLSGGDLKFVGEGTFVGWTGVTLGREYDDPFTNDNYPTEVFRFRPDFVQNVPARMTRPLYSWQETN